MDNTFLSKEVFDGRTFNDEQERAWAVANKLAKACYYLMKGERMFDPKQLFGELAKRVEAA